MSREMLVFKKEAKEKFGDKFEYLEIVPDGKNKAIKFNCRKHGVQKRRTSTFLSSKSGCVKCGKIDRRELLTGVDHFISVAKEKYGDKYTYDLTGYLNNRSIITVNCKTLGSFKLIAGNFLRLKYGLNSIFKNENTKKGNSSCIDFDTFKSKAIEKYGNKFTYSKEKFTENKVIVNCPEHGEFETKPVNFLSKRVKFGCRSCSMDDKSKFRPLTKKNDWVDTFIKKAKKKHNGKFSYIIDEYSSMKNTTIKIVCSSHGEVEQNAEVHLRSAFGCPECASESIESSGSAEVRNQLISKGLEFEVEKVFDGMIGVRGGNLRVDFFVEKLNLAIEFDGEQHFKKIKRWDKKLSLTQRIKNDEIKNHYCMDNGINLLRIRYDENIEEKINGCLMAIKKHQNIPLMMCYQNF